MRTALIVLVIFNLALLAALKIKPAQSPQRPLPAGINSDKVNIIPMQESIRVVARCVELGPLSPQESAAARQMLEARALGELVTSVEASFNDGWWVYIPARGSRADSLKRAKELEKLGVRDLHVFDEGANRNAISLGVFRTQEAAAEYLADLARRGVRSAKAARQAQRVSANVLYIRSQVPEVIAQVTEVKAQFARAELRQVNCPQSADTLPQAMSR